MLFVSDLCYLYPTCVICIGLVLFVSVFWVIVVFVIYIFVIITACNVIYIHYICIKKQRKQEQKNVTLPSAKAKALGKVTIKGLQETLFAES